MKSFCLSLMILIMSCLPALGQSAVSSNSGLQGVKFSISGEALGYVGGGQSLIAADAVDETRISPALSLRNDNIILSSASSHASIAVFALGGPMVYLPFQKIMSKTFLDPNHYKFYAVGEGGIVTSGAGQSLAESLGGGLDYFPSGPSGLVVNLFDVRWLHGQVPIGDRTVSVIQQAGSTGTPVASPIFAGNGIAISVGIGM